MLRLLGSLELNKFLANCVSSVGATNRSMMLSVGQLLKIFFSWCMKYVFEMNRTMTWLHDINGREDLKG